MDNLISSKILFDKTQADYIFRDKVGVKQEMFIKKMYSQFVKFKAWQHRN